MEPGSEDWNMLYDEPKNLYLELVRKKKEKSVGRESFFNCPAVTDRLKSSFIFRNNLDSHVTYDASDPLSPEVIESSGLGAQFVRGTNMAGGASINFSMAWLFFCEESVEAMTNVPAFHEPSDFSQKGFISPGKFDISKWFRPIMFEAQFWNPVDSVNILSGDPLFYIEFLTDRPVELKRFKMTQQLNKYSHFCSTTIKRFEPRLPLVDRYKRFLNTKTDRLVLKEIKENLVE